MKKVLFATMAMCAWMVAEHEAHACSPPSDPGRVVPTLTSVKVMSRDHLARNIGIPLDLSGYGVLDAAFVNANLTVSVSASSGPIEGTLEALGEPGARAYYRWQATSGLTPAGALTVTMKTSKEAIVETVTVDDRIAVAASTPVTIDVTRDVVADEKAPAIVCTRKRGVGECAGPGDEVSRVSTRWIGVPTVAATIAPPAVAADAPFVQVITELYGKDRGGATSPRTGFRYAEGVVEHAQLDRAYDEYCATTTTRILGVAESATATTCRPQAVELSVPNDTAVERIRTYTTGCDSTTYPDGTSEADPTGDGGGCNVAPRASHAPIGELALAALALVAIRARRERRR